ncbi:MAG: HDIG domain-containing protein [Euryarchaeota archaeon]|nr:HDIG domain-containing protein [Euryarchaeota archaeon]
MTPKDTLHLLHKADCPPDVIAHAHAVAKYAREIAERYNARHRNPADLELVITGALLHDIGRARSNGIDHAIAGAEIAQAFGLDERIVRIIKRHIGAGIPKDEAERLGLPREDYLPETAEEMIVAHADNLVDDTERISIDERMRRMRARGFDSDAIERMIRLHNAVMG